MSEVKVNKLSPRSGTTVTIGDSGDTINIVGTLQNNGSALTGDISSVVAGTGLSGGGTSGDVTINIEAAQPTITSLGTITTFRSTGIDDNADALAITIDSSENVGIGTASPAAVLDVRDETNGANFIVGGSGTTNITKIGGGGGDSLAIYSGTSTKVATFSTSGNTFLEGGIYLSGETASANELSDYEEGTWSPKLGNETTAVYSNQTGWYRKIGNTVFIYFSLSLSSKGDISGSYTKIANLPFNGSPSTQFGSGQIHAYRLGSSAHIQGIEFGGSVPSVGWIMTGGGGTTGYLNTSFVADNTYFEGFAMYRTA